MLRAVHSNRTEGLVAALLEELPPANPFAPRTIVVGGHLVARWLSREIALARGIAAGLDLVTFDRFVERTWAEGDARLAVLDRKQLAAAFASVLADPQVTAGLAPVAQYLAAAPADGDRAGPRRVQLAEHLAELAWNYALTRPDWMPALVAGQVPGELAGHPAARWQASLIAAALDHARAAPVPMLPWLRRRAGMAPPRLDAPVAVFGMSFLARAQLEALSDLASTSEVVVYALDPCRELWDDVGGRGAEPGSDPVPLVMWGRPIRDTLSSLVDRAAGDLDDRFAEPAVPIEPAAGDQFAGPAVPNALARLLADVANRTMATVTAPDGDAANHAATVSANRRIADAGVRVLACPNLRREIDVVAAQARACLDANPALSAHQIGVWIAGDAERYLAQAPSAFEAVGVPCHQIDAPIDDRGRIGEAVLALLELPTSTMTRRDLLRVMTHPAVLAGYPHVDASDWVRWTERLGIVHGADGSAHDGTYLERHRDQFHWDQGVRRLALGAFMVGDRPGDDSPRPAVQIGELHVAPEEIRPEQQASAATYALLVRSLCRDAAWLSSHEASLSRWADILVGLVDVYLGSRDDDSRDVERVRKMLAGLAHVDLDGRPVGFREAREHAIHQLATARANRGEPLAAGVMIGPLAAMRAVPFEINFVVGLDAGAFPAGDTPSPLDLRGDRRAGDVPPRDRDRVGFLEVLLGTRRELYLSYVAVEDKSGQPLGPSSVVLELADALAPYLGAASSKAALAAITEHHPLHRFAERPRADNRSSSPAATALPPAIARERWAASVRDALRAHLRASGHAIPDEDGMMTLLAHPDHAQLREALGIVAAPDAVPAASSRPVSISNLRKFLCYPVQAWAQAVLGLDELPDDSVAETSDEPFQLERPERAELLREVFAAQLRDPGAPVRERYRATIVEKQRRGQYPVGVFGEAAEEIDVRVLESWRELLGPILLRNASGVAAHPGEPGFAAVGGVTRIAFGRASSPGAELRPALEIPLSGGRTVRLVGQTELMLRPRERARHTSVVTMLRKLDKKTSEHLRGAFDHLLLAAAGIAPEGHAHIVLDAKTGGKLEVEHDPWTPAEARAYLGALVGELYDLPHGYLLPFDALARVLGGDQAKFWGDVTGGLGYGPIERRDGLVPPDDAGDMARRRLAPLVARMRGDHGFENRIGGRS